MDISVVTRWWIADMPPVPGLLRAVFYLGLLVICLIDYPSPLQSPGIIRETERAIYTPVRVLTALGIRWVEPTTLATVTRLTIVAWIAAAVGLAQPLSGLLVFLGFAFLHAVNAGALGSNHSTHSALYALFCMCFSVSHDFSVDGFLSAHAHLPLLVPAGSVLESGFAPKLLLVFLAYIMFAGAVSKLRNGGLAWLNGVTLRYYIEQSAVVWRIPRLARALVARPELCRGLAWATVLIELSAPLVLWIPLLRVPMVLAWSGLHVGILLVMMPAYWVQMWCYLLVLDWRPVAAAVTGRQPASFVAPTDDVGAIALSVFGLLACVTLLVVLVRHSEQWPFTSVPMYSNGVLASAQRLPAPEELHQRAMRALRGHPGAWKRAWVAEEVMEDVRIVPVDGGEPVSLFHALAAQGAGLGRWSQFAKLVRAVAIADIVAWPAGRLDLDGAGAESAATRFLRTMVPVVTRGLSDWRAYERLELVCRTESGWLVIGRADLSTTADAAAEGGGS